MGITPMGDKLYREIRKHKRLETAWKRVRDNARKSRSKKTRAEVDDFGSDIHTHLKSIQGQLVKGSFRFAPARGWAEPPSNPQKKHRPIVITPIKSRIVQRSILDVLLEEKGIQTYIDQPFSFGGIKKLDPDREAAVPGAIKAAVDHISLGNLHYIRSDISGFFQKIPKKPVMSKIKEVVDDEQFCHMIDQAIHVELENLAELREHADLFPLEDIGVAQGCALSPLFGNILLSDFDRELNSGSCTCIRYIDDFLIVGSSEAVVSEAFETAQEHLGKYKMEAYNPLDRPDKAERGHIENDGVTFLGVEINNGSIRPSKSNRGKLLQSIKEISDANTKHKPPHDGDWNYNQSYLKFLLTANNVVSGWGNQYYFCNDRKIMDDMDQSISDTLKHASDKFRGMMGGLDSLGRRRLLGVKSLSDCKIEPIRWQTPDKAA